VNSTFVSGFAMTVLPQNETLICDSEVNTFKLYDFGSSGSFVLVRKI
jgi:hypothetical protein